MFVNISILHLSLAEFYQNCYCSTQTHYLFRVFFRFPLCSNRWLTPTNHRPYWWNNVTEYCRRVPTSLLVRQLLMNINYICFCLTAVQSPTETVQNLLGEVDDEQHQPHSVFCQLDLLFSFDSIKQWREYARFVLLFTCICLLGWFDVWSLHAKSSSMIYQWLPVFQ